MSCSFATNSVAGCAYPMRATGIFGTNFAPSEMRGRLSVGCVAQFGKKFGLMLYQVVFSPEALAQLEALYGYVAQAASPDIASRYTNAIVTYCEGLHTFPLRGTRRDDVRPGLRIGMTCSH